SLARLEAEKTRALPRTLVMGANERAALPAVNSKPRTLHISSGAGELLAITMAPGERLPALPAGYYECWFDDDPETRGRLIVTPGQCFLPEALSGDQRHFGFAAHLYALRRHGDYGIGDFETLARFGEASAIAGGVVAGINPLHNLF